MVTENHGVVFPGQADGILFNPWAAASAAPAASAGDKGGSFTGAIAQAKRKLAEALGMGAEKVEITIRL